jgi:mercuric reductase
MHDTYDLVILGSGSTAFAAATHARELGKTAVMIEVRTLGGTCVNRGCLPSKNLIEAARLVFDAAHPRYPGLTPASLRLDFPTLIAQKDELIRAYRNQHYASILDEAANEELPALEVVEGCAALIDPHTVEVTFSTSSSRRLIGDQVLIATGSSPVIPDVPGLSMTPYLTSDLLTSQEDAELKTSPSSLVILGGGYIALELGQMFARFGTQVTILERSERILKDYEPEISIALTDVLREEGLNIVTSTTLQQVTDDTNQVQVKALVRGQQQHFQSEKLLVATSRRPNTRHIGLERAGVELNS